MRVAAALTALLLLLTGCSGLSYTPLTPDAVQRSLDRGNGCFNAINCSSSHES